MLHSNNDHFYLALIANNTDPQTHARVKAIEALLGYPARDAVRDAAPPVKVRRRRKRIVCRFPAYAFGERVQIRSLAHTLGHPVQNIARATFGQASGCGHQFCTERST
jgi:hypothetical protein